MKIVKANKTQLQSPLTPTDTTVRLKDFVDSKGNKIEMSAFGSEGVIVVKEGDTIESILFTGVTQNSDGTATLTVANDGGTPTPALTGRDLDPVSPYAGYTSGQDFNIGAEAIITNDPYTLSRFMEVDSDNTLAGLISYDQFPVKTGTDTDLLPEEDNQFTTKKYVDELTVAGAPDANGTAKGLVEIASATEIDADAEAGDGNTTADLAITPEQLALSKYNTRLPSSDEKDAMTASDNPSTANPFLTSGAIDISEGAPVPVAGDYRQPIISSATQLRFLKAYYTPSNTAVQTDSAEQSTTSTTYAEVKSITVAQRGRVLVRFEMNGSNDQHGAFGRITKDGVPVVDGEFKWGDETYNSANYVYRRYEMEVDIDSLDTDIALEIRSEDPAGTTLVRNLEICYDANTSALTDFTSNAKIVRLVADATTESASTDVHLDLAEVSSGFFNQDVVLKSWVSDVRGFVRFNYDVRQSRSTSTPAEYGLSRNGAFQEELREVSTTYDTNVDVIWCEIGDTIELHMKGLYNENTSTVRLYAREFKVRYDPVDQVKLDITSVTETTDEVVVNVDSTASLTGSQAPEKVNIRRAEKGTKITNLDIAEELSGYIPTTKALGIVASTNQQAIDTTAYKTVTNAPTYSSLAYSNGLVIGKAMIVSATGTLNLEAEFRCDVADAGDGIYMTYSVNEGERKWLTDINGTITTDSRSDDDAIWRTGYGLNIEVQAGDKIEMLVSRMDTNGMAGHLRNVSVSYDYTLLDGVIFQ